MTVSISSKSFLSWAVLYIFVSILFLGCISIGSNGIDESYLTTNQLTPYGIPLDIDFSTAEDNIFHTTDIVNELKHSVVQITTESLSTSVFRQPIPRTGVGTGVIVTPDGHILTNNHVVDGSQSVTVTLSNKESFPAIIIGQDQPTDLAIIRIPATNLKPATLGHAYKTQVGEDVIAIGHALGLRGGPTVSKGVISALNRSIDINPQTTIVGLLQTDTSINHGNSGGPLVNKEAKVIGINTAIIESGRGIGFAINIDESKIIIDQLIENGYVKRGFLGITPFNLTPNLASRFNMPVTQGVIIADITSPNSPAFSAGLRQEDIIIQLGDSQIGNTGELSKFLLSHQFGDSVSVTYLRKGKRLETVISLGDNSKERGS